MLCNLVIIESGNRDRASKPVPHHLVLDLSLDDQASIEIPIRIFTIIAFSFQFRYDPSIYHFFKLQPDN
jgi:hypothetical protein